MYRSASPQHVVASTALVAKMAARVGRVSGRARDRRMEPRVTRRTAYRVPRARCGTGRLLEEDSPRPAGWPHGACGKRMPWRTGARGYTVSAHLLGAIRDVSIAQDTDAASVTIAFLFLIEPPAARRRACCDHSIADRVGERGICEGLANFFVGTCVVITVDARS